MSNAPATDEALKETQTPQQKQKKGINNQWGHVRVYACMYLCVYTCMLVCFYVCLLMCMHASVLVFMLVRVCVRIPTCTCG